MYVIPKCGRNQTRKKTVGWKLLVQWNGEYESWIHLKDMKEYHLVEVAEFTNASGIAEEPAFASRVL